MFLIEDGLNFVYTLILLSVSKSSISIKIFQIPIQENTELVTSVPSSFFLLITQNSKSFTFKKIHFTL